MVRTITEIDIITDLTQSQLFLVDKVEVIEFSTGEGRIRINKKNTKTYYNQTKYDQADNADNVWHMVVVMDSI